MLSVMFILLLYGDIPLTNLKHFYNMLCSDKHTPHSVPNLCDTLGMFTLCICFLQQVCLSCIFLYFYCKFHFHPIEEFLEQILKVQERSEASTSCIASRGDGSKPSKDGSSEDSALLKHKQLNKSYQTYRRNSSTLFLDR